jgi:hypothetical protein
VLVLGASFSVGYRVSISFVWSSHEQLDMGPWFTMAVRLLQHGGFHFSMAPWFSSLLQHYDPHLSMEPSSLVYFSTMVHTYPWDPSIWLYIKRLGQFFHKGDGMLGS